MSTLFENIVIPIKVGDTVLGGKFKNKRIVVKSIGKNEKGDITINGRPLLKYRMVVDEMVQVDLQEGVPFPMDTPNEFTYMDFKKYAYRKRGLFKKELLKANGDSSKMFKILSGLWYNWAKKNAPSFTRITDTKKFGRALMVMMVKDNLVFDRDNWKKTNKITKLQEIFYDNLGNPCSGNVTMDGRCIADEVDDRPLEETEINEVGVFPVTNYISGIIPQGRLDTNTPENKKKSLKLVKDLKTTLNKFWKEHDIPFRIK